jgi:DNA-binding phage protein
MADTFRHPLYCCPCPVCRTQPESPVAREHAAINHLLATLDEKARRQCAGLLALQQGRGGITRLAEITGLSRNTIRRGHQEIQKPAPALVGRIRQPGGGRKPIEKKIPPC